MGLAFVRLGQPETAVSHFEDALRFLNPQQRASANARELIHAGLAEAHLAMNQPEHAIAAFDPLPGGFWPLSILGDAYRTAGKAQQARDAYQHSIKCYSNYQEPYLGLAELDLAEKNFSAAEQQCRRAMRCPSLPLRVYTCLARIFVRQGRLRELSLMLEKLRTSGIDLEPMRKDPELALHFANAHA
jgi:tetratricopeptide (TPR) repeat protein